MLENRHYVIIDPNNGYEKDGELAKIKLIDTEFSGIEYSYGVVNLGQDTNDEENFRVSFEYTIHDDNKEKILSDENIKKRFENVVSSVLNSILTETVDRAEERYNDELRKENT